MIENLEKLKLLSEKAYSLCSILKDYCKLHADTTEEFANAFPLIEYLHDNIDILNNNFINIDL